MIVRPAGDGIHLITQPDHAALSGRIMSQCSGLALHPRRASILRAISQHDGGWQQPDADPLIDAEGHVVDFVHATLAVRHGVWARAVTRLREDPWAAALVAEHAAHVYSRFREDAAWRAFFREMETQRDTLRAEADLPLATLREDYDFLRLGDLLSLTFCTGSTDEHQHRHWTVQHRDGRVSITPRMFTADAALAVQARHLAGHTFHSQAAFATALAAAPSMTLTGRLIA
jgi:hypothetical protein